MSARPTMLRLAKSVVFCALLVVMLWSLDFVAKPGSGTINPWPAERETRREVEVIALGSSRTYCTVLPMEMWRQAGVTGLDLTAAVQPVEVTLAYLEQVLKTQRPKVVMLELYMFGKQTSFDLVEAHNSMDHMPAGVLRTATTLRSVDATAWFDVLFPLQMYHSRWSELTVQDFKSDKNARVAYARGAMYLAESKPVPAEVKYDDIAQSAYGRDLAFVREMAALCAGHDAALILFTSPSPWRLRAGDQLLLTRLQSDLKPEFPTVGFMDMNVVTDTVGVSLQTDYMDELHVNHRGAAKLSRWLADYLVQEYGLADHRGDAFASRWNESLREYDKVFKADW